MLRRASIPLPLAGFGLELLQSQAERCGVCVATFVERAAARYAAEADRESPSRRVPDFLKGDGPALGDTSVDVELGPEVWSMLEQEADAQAVPIELVVIHAAMLLAAKLE
jgi:hypothetical protein